MPDQKTMENYLSNEPYFGTIGENDQNEFWRAGSWIGPIVHRPVTGDPRRPD